MNIRAREREDETGKEIEERSQGEESVRRGELKVG